MQRIKKHFRLAKVGHAGTLDPNATGVLILCVGSATRLTRFLTCDPKEYEAEMILGIKTDTQDITGRVVGEESSDICPDKVKEVFDGFLGYVDQIPPMVSAVKVGGKPLYVYARRGEDIPRKPRKIQIFELEILKLVKDTRQRVLFRVVCSKGTYIRTLCNNIGDYLGCGACLGSLVRTASGSFKLEDALTVDTILKLGPEGLEETLVPVSEALGHYKSVTVKDSFRARVLNGGFLAYNMISSGTELIEKDEIILILDGKENLLGIAKAQTRFSGTTALDPRQMVLQPICVLTQS